MAIKDGLVDTRPIMRVISIKTKVIAMVCSGVALLALATLGLTEASYRENIDTVASEAINIARLSWESLSEAEIRTISAAMSSVIENRDILAAWTANDRDKLIQISTPIFTRFRDTFGITQFNYIDIEQRRLLTMSDPNDPKLIGSPTDRFDVKQAVRTQTWSTGLAMGNHAFALRVARPVFDSGMGPNGRLLGYLEFGTEISKFLDRLVHQSRREYGMILKKEYFKAETWAIQRQHLGLRNNWDDQPNLVVVSSTDSSESLFDLREDLNAIPKEGKSLGLIRQGDKLLSRGLFPVREASGALVGAIFVLSDVSGLHAQLSAKRLNILSLAIILLLVFSIALLYMLQVWVFRRLERISRAATAMVGGEFNTPIKVTKRDEIGQFEGLFEQFRQIYLKVLDELEKRRPPP